MKKSFYDLMDLYTPEEEPQEYKISAENVKEKAMRKINKTDSRRKIHISKKFCAAAAAVSAAAMLGGAAFAYEAGVFDRAISFFESDRVSFATKPSTEPLDGKDLEAIESEMKNDNNTAVESNGTTLELEGSMYDENVAYFFFKLTAPEGTVLSEDKYEFRDEMFDITWHGYGGVGGRTEFSDDNPNDNVIYFTYVFDGDISQTTLHGINFEDLRMPARTPEEKLGEVMPDMVASGHWYVPITLGEVENTIDLLDEECEINYTDLDTGENHTANILSCRISPLSVYMTADKIICTDPQLVMKDGSVYEIDFISIMDTENGNGIYSGHQSFGKPINIEDIDYIQIGDAQIDVN